MSQVENTHNFHVCFTVLSVQNFTKNETRIAKQEPAIACVKNTVLEEMSTNKTEKRKEQSSLHSFFSSKSSQDESASIERSKDCKVTPQQFGIRVYTSAEIDGAVGLEKTIENFGMRKLEKYVKTKYLWASWETKLLCKVQSTQLGFCAKQIF